jgi:hypothetical protein
MQLKNIAATIANIQQMSSTTNLSAAQFNPLQAAGMDTFESSSVKFGEWKKDGPNDWKKNGC